MGTQLLGGGHGGHRHLVTCRFALCAASSTSYTLLNGLLSARPMWAHACQRLVNGRCQQAGEQAVTLFSFCILARAPRAFGVTRAIADCRAVAAAAPAGGRARPRVRYHLYRCGSQRDVVAGVSADKFDLCIFRGSGLDHSRFSRLSPAVAARAHVAVLSFRSRRPSAQRRGAGALRTRPPLSLVL